MFFNFFKKEKKEDEKIKNEIIEIIDDNGNKQQVDKNKWLNDNIFKILVQENVELSYKCDAIKLAMEYGIYLEILEASLSLYADNKNNFECVNLMFEVYYNNKQYSDAINIYEQYLEDGNSLSSNMYYKLALAYEKIKDMKSMEKYLFFAFNDNNSNMEAINKLMEYMKEYEADTYQRWLSNLAYSSNSQYLYYKLAQLEYELGNVDAAKDASIKCLEYNWGKYAVKIGKLFKENKLYVEYSNYILSRYDINNSSIELHLSVLHFYNKDNQFEEGLKLLKELYEKNIYNEMFIKYEQAFLAKLLKKQSKTRYENYIVSANYGDYKQTIVQGVIYSKIFKEYEKLSANKKIFVLPFVINGNSEKYNLKFIAKNLHLYINDKICKDEKICSKAIMLYNQLGLNLVTKEYDAQYLQAITNANPSLDYILSGSITSIPNKETFELKIYTYDTKLNTKVDRFVINTNLETLHLALNKFFNNCMKDILQDTFNFSNIDSEAIDIYVKYMEIFLQVNGYNKYRIYQTDRIIKYFLRRSQAEDIRMLLSLVQMQKGFIPIIKKKYQKDIYSSVINLANDKDILKLYNKVMEDEK